jgi:hypothetical protein
MAPVWFAVFGGFAINFLRLAELAQTPQSERPRTFSDPLYVLQFVVLPLLGGGLAYTYQSSGTILSPILAFNIGVSAPLILKNLASAIPPLGTRKVN